MYSCKKVLTQVFRKMKASSTNWLVWIIFLKPWLAKFPSRKINSSDQYPLKGVLCTILTIGKYCLENMCRTLHMTRHDVSYSCQWKNKDFNFVKKLPRYVSHVSQRVKSNKLIISGCQCTGKVIFYTFSKNKLTIKFMFHL